MLPAPLDAVTIEDLRRLVDDQVPESASLEFKEALDLSTEQAKDELVTDIAAFANGSGGDLLFGVSERGEKGKAGFATDCDGIELENEDATIRRIQDLLQARLEPRLVGVRLRGIEVASGRRVLVVRISRSWQLHAVKRNSAYVVPARNGNGKYLMDFGQIRGAILGGATAYERARQMRAERAVRVGAGDGPRRLRDLPILLLHILPVSAFGGLSERGQVDLASLAGSLRTMRSSSSNWTYNTDGFLVYANDSDGCSEYTQVFRDGRLEAATTELTMTVQGTDRRYFVGFVPSVLAAAVDRYLAVLREQGVIGPLIVAMTIVNAKGVHISDEPRWTSFGKTPVDRDLALLPEVELPDAVSESVSADRALGPLFDAYCQAGGHPRCTQLKAEEPT